MQTELIEREFNGECIAGFHPDMADVFVFPVNAEGSDYYGNFPYMEMLGPDAIELPTRAEINKGYCLKANTNNLPILFVIIEDLYSRDSMFSLVEMNLFKAIRTLANQFQKKKILVPLLFPSNNRKVSQSYNAVVRGLNRARSVLDRNDIGIVISIPQDKVEELEFNGLIIQGREKSGNNDGHKKAKEKKNRPSSKADHDELSSLAEEQEQNFTEQKQESKEDDERQMIPDIKHFTGQYFLVGFFEDENNDSRTRFYENSIWENAESTYNDYSEVVKSI